MTVYTNVRKNVAKLPDTDTPVNENLHIRQIDKHVGDRIRERRIMMGYTQQEMAS
nr:hypothetical protein [Sneathiella glossodoripedis]